MFSLVNLSTLFLQAESTGRIVTLMSNDAQKLQDAMMAIHSMWGSPLFIIAVLVLLWQQVRLETSLQGQDKHQNF